MGQLANLTMGLMIMPVSRNGVWQKVSVLNVTIQGRYGIYLAGFGCFKVK